MKTLLVISGPTASGKSTLALKLAEQFRTEIISSDSRQFYKGMDIGTAKPTEYELKLVPHHFISILKPDEDYTTGAFEQDVLQLLNLLFQKHDIVIMTGGSGLYNRAVMYGLDELPASNEELRTQLNIDFETKGITFLQDKLKELDPEYFDEVDRANPHRLIRAIEVCLLSDNKYSELRKNTSRSRPFSILHVVLNPERDILYERINQRVDQMIESGLLEEVKSLLPFRNQNALKSVGYTELFRYLDGEIELEEAIRLIKQNSRNYAKRQVTWLRREKDILQIEQDQYPEAEQIILEAVRSLSKG